MIIYGPFRLFSFEFACFGTYPSHAFIRFALRIPEGDKSEKKTIERYSFQIKKNYIAPTYVINLNKTKTLFPETFLIVSLSKNL